jgi:hypothetical protein
MSVVLFPLKVVTLVVARYGLTLSEGDWIARNEDLPAVRELVNQFRLIGVPGWCDWMWADAALDQVRTLRRWLECNSYVE